MIGVNDELEDDHLQEGVIYNAIAEQVAGYNQLLNGCRGQ
jgi:hypothetical protein